MPRRRRFESRLFPAQRMFEPNLPRVQAKWWIVCAQRLRVAFLAARQINRVAANRKSQMPQMHSYLVRATRQWPHFQQGRAIRISFFHAEFGPCIEPIFKIHVARTKFHRLRTNRRVAGENILRRMPLPLSRYLPTPTPETFMLMIHSAVMHQRR